MFLLLQCEHDHPLTVFSDHDVNVPLYSDPSHKTAATIQVKKYACFSATEFLTDDTFTAPESGTLKAVKLIHGYGEVSSSIGLGYNNWGMFLVDGSTSMMVQLLRHYDDGTEETVLPTANTEGIRSVAPIVCTNGHGCSVYTYTMDQYNATSDELRWSESVYVNTGDVFSLQYSEACCDFGTSDNGGISCADVYFEYEYIITESPTTDPIKDPSENPTPVPTIASPTTMPTPYPTTADPSLIPTQGPYI